MLKQRRDNFQFGGKHKSQSEAYGIFLPHLKAGRFFQKCGSIKCGN